MKQKMNNLKYIKIKIPGDSLVGKTSILNSFADFGFRKILAPTVGLYEIQKKLN